MPLAKGYVLYPNLSLVPLSGEATPVKGAPMLVGASKLNDTEWRAQNNISGPWSAARDFNSGGFQTSFGASNAAGDIGRCASILSHKPSLSAMASGALDATVEAFYGSMPDDHVCFACIWHEGDVKYRHGTEGVTPATYVPAFTRFADIVHSLGKPRLYVTQIFGNWPVTHGGIGQPGEFYCGPGRADVVGWDMYMQGNAGGTAASDIDPCVAYSRSIGAEWGIAELGLNSDVTNTAAGAAWVTAHVDYAAVTPGTHHASACFVTTFDTGTPPFPSASPVYQAASAAYSSHYQANYKTFAI